MDVLKSSLWLSALNKLTVLSAAAAAAVVAAMSIDASRREHHRDLHVSIYSSGNYSANITTCLLNRRAASDHL